jgi:F-type H+-transporting ATPase subunit d
LGLGKNTTAAVQTFRKRADDARRQLTALKNQKTDVDFGHYKSVLKNQEVINQAEKILREFKPVTYDVSSQLKAIDAFEAKAVEQAQASSDKIEAELKDLKATLKNIEDARPFDQLSVDDVIAARPEIGQTVEAMVKAGKWTTPQYSEKFGSEFNNQKLYYSRRIPLTFFYLSPLVKQTCPLSKVADLLKCPTHGFAYRSHLLYRREKQYIILGTNMAKG